MQFFQFFILLILIILLISLKRRIELKVLWRYTSDISGKIEVAQKYNGELVLLTNGFAQGVSIDDPSIKKSYWYKVALDILKHSKGRKKSSVLFIGLGANTGPLLVNKENSSIRMVIVEIDPIIIQACREYFHLDELNHAEVIPADIFDLLKQKKTAWKNTFDVILIDAFEAKPPYFLEGSHDPKFLKQLYLWLKQDGMFLFNSPNNMKGLDIESLKAYLETIFNKVEYQFIRDPRGYRNHVISASIKR